ncbi:MAG: hypothetical protein VKJ24_00720 [Synechococcales bacterium]|nr:hypothetical protein [Synechococcales bacterium]
MALRSLNGLRSQNRRTPITLLLLSSGAVNVAIAACNHQDGLMLVGLGTVGITLALRWLQHQRSRQ